MSAEDRYAVETKISDVRTALKGDDIEAVKARGTELAELMQKVSTAAYEAASAAAGAAGTDPADETGQAGPDDETVEGEFKEV